MKHFIKILTATLIVFTMQLCLYSQSNMAGDTLPKQTRKSTLKEAFPMDSLQRSPMLKAFKGFGIESVTEAYRLNRIAVDSVLQHDSLRPDFWRIYGYQAMHVFVQAKESPRMALSLFLPPFIFLFLVLIVPYLIKTFLFRPKLEDAVKPDNDPNATAEVTDEGHESGEK
ncbi:MAG: hypothetical protein Q8O72_14630 [Bacteroidales bacterium]|nr:hypothetical protein [Bacteroidales bacterium]